MERQPSIVCVVIFCGLLGSSFTFEIRVQAQCWENWTRCSQTEFFWDADQEAPSVLSEPQVEFSKPRNERRKVQELCENMTEWANVFEKAKHMCRYLFEKSKLTRDRLFGVADGENDFAAIRIAVIELFPDSIIYSFQTRSSVRRNDHFTNGSRTLSETGSQIANVLGSTNLVTGGQDVAGLMKRKLVRRLENRAQRRRNRALDALASTVEKLEESLMFKTWKICESSPSPCARG